MKWLLLIILPINVFAAGGEGIPFSKLIIPQIINVTFFLGLILYFTKDMIVAHFRDKKASFEAAQNAAAKAKELAAQKHAEMKMKIDNLTSTAEAEKAKAISSAEDLKIRLIESAKQQALKLQKDAEATAGAELQRAIMTLRTETITKASDVAKSQMQQTSDSSQLQKSFVRRVQGASL